MIVRRAVIILSSISVSFSFRWLMELSGGPFPYWQNKSQLHHRLEHDQTKQSQQTSVPLLLKHISMGYDVWSGGQRWEICKSQYLFLQPANCSMTKFPTDFTLPLRINNAAISCLRQLIFLNFQRSCNFLPFIQHQINLFVYSDGQCFYKIIRKEWFEAVCNNTFIQMKYLMCSDLNRQPQINANPYCTKTDQRAEILLLLFLFLLKEKQ